MRQLDVHENKVGTLLFRSANAGLAIPGFRHLISGTAQEVAEDLPIVLLVLDYQICSCRRLHLPLNDDRERECKCRALAKLRLDPDPTAMHLNDALGDGQSQAGAALLPRDSIVGLLELLKELGLIGRRDARPSIADRHMERAIVRFSLDGNFAGIGELDGVTD